MPAPVEVSKIEEFFNKCTKINLAPVERFLESVEGVDLSDVFKAKEREKLKDYVESFMNLAIVNEQLQSDKEKLKEWLQDDSNKVRLMDVTNQNLLEFKNLLLGFLSKRPSKEQPAKFIAKIEGRDLRQRAFMLKGKAEINWAY